MKYPDFTRELLVPKSCPFRGVTPFRIVAVHYWKYLDTPYSEFIRDPDIIKSRQPTQIQILRSNRSLPLPPLSKFQHSNLLRKFGSEAFNINSRSRNLGLRIHNWGSAPIGSTLQLRIFLEGCLNLCVLVG